MTASASERTLSPKFFRMICTTAFLVVLLRRETRADLRDDVGAREAAPVTRRTGHGEQHLDQARFFFQWTGKLPLARNRDRTGFFGNHDHHGIGLLGESERGTMA